MLALRSHLQLFWKVPGRATCCHSSTGPQEVEVVLRLPPASRQEVAVLRDGAVSQGGPEPSLLHSVLLHRALVWKLKSAFTDPPVYMHACPFC